MGKPLSVGFISLMEEASWLSLVVIIPKNTVNSKCVEFWRLNVATKKDPYPLPFIEEVLDKVTSHKDYSFLDGFFSYHQIMITSKNKYNTTFIIHWKTFVWVVMPFRLKNAPPTYQWVGSMVFKDYFGVFMKLFLDDFNMFNDLNTHLTKLWLCFNKCRNFDIKFESWKMYVPRALNVILGYVVSKEGKLPNLKKILVVVHMPTPKTPKDIMVFNGMAQYY